MSTILIADDDASICIVLEQAMRRQGYQTRVTHHPAELRSWVAAGSGHVVITDVVMPGGNGLDLLPELVALRPELPVIVISAQNTLTTAVQAAERGAFDYLPKPFDLDELLIAVQKALIAKPQPEEATPTRNDLPLIGGSAAMQEVYKIIARLVNVDLTVMIRGESGTGKERIARAIHDLGKRKIGPFVAVNMAAIPRELIESELFGHEKGSFTGAHAKKTGRFEQAQGGTLFLDEIGDMPMDAQTRLLRVLQEGEFTTVGGTAPIKTDVRIICATHRDLHERMQGGDFRQDLYYRLNVVPLRLPPLRERGEDIAPLSRHFLQLATEKGLPKKRLSGAAQSALLRHGWPGNVRELENLMYRLAALHPAEQVDEISLTREMTRRDEGAEAGDAAAMAAPAGTAPIVITGGAPRGSLQDSILHHLDAYFAAHVPELPSPGLYDRILCEMEKPLLTLTLRACRGNQVKAAELLGINRNTLRKKMQHLGLSR